MTLRDLRRAAVTWSILEYDDLATAISALGFVQADPIRAPARAQDLMLRQRVPGYHAGDLERLYQTLAVEEDFVVNYGFVTREVQALMHPRGGLRRWPSPGRKKAEAVLAFVRERGRVHPRDVDAHFAHGSVRNYWGGSSSATTHALDHLHYRGLLRVAGREGGIRLYAPREVPPPAVGAAERRARLDALIDVLVKKYAPVHTSTLTWLVARLRLATPQWHREVPAALARARHRLAHARVDGVSWYWHPEQSLADDAVHERVRFLAPFDPVVWDRRRFEALWEWPYRFEAYTPAAKRQFGYYALPLLWRDVVIGWVNASVVDQRLVVVPGYVSGRPPRDRAFRREFDAEVARMQEFLTGRA
ncbi:MAG: YcaQ family DNA glycosylase [Acidobacteria bacterium]|nr:YcaQ family DNA glycosylase [Acidobacteriota bacterium]